MPTACVKETWDSGSAPGQPASGITTSSYSESSIWS
jgi:hypothetical protein